MTKKREKLAWERETKDWWQTDYGKKTPKHQRIPMPGLPGQEKLGPEVPLKKKRVPAGKKRNPRRNK